MGKNLEKEEVVLPVYLLMVGLREARVKQKLKQFAVAEELGMTERAYRNIELGETKSISVAKLQRLAEILAVESWCDFIKNKKENKNITQILEANNNSPKNLNQKRAEENLGKSKKVCNFRL
jgi:transcriptional regulator with XRE-family HTH domain